ncbi:MAG: AI-2E family transporter [Oscillospiraceae bacterium]|nr:AI-2E family transporter [Oscillospiraceae bacterium]
MLKQGEWNRKYLAGSFYAFGVLAAAILFYFGISKLVEAMMWLSSFMKALKPIFNGLLLAYIVNPLLMWIEKSLKALLKVKKLRNTNLSEKVIRGISVSFSWAVLILIIAFMVVVLIPCITANISKIDINELVEYVSSGGRWLEELLNLPAKTLSDQFNNSLKNMLEVVTKSLRDLSPHVITFATQLTKGIFNVFVTCVVSFYFLYSKEVFCAQAKKFLSAFLKTEKLQKMVEIVRELNSTFNSFMFGKFLNSVVVGIVCYVGMLILRIPYSVLISTIIGIANMIPYFGPLIGAVPSCIILLLVSPLKALLFIALIIVLQISDANILSPKILGDKTGLTGFWVIFAIILFGDLFGIIGMILGVPIFATFYVFTKRLVEKKLLQKGLPTETSDYLNRRGNEQSSETGSLD